MIRAAMQHAMRSPLQSAMDRIGSAVWTPATLFAASEQGVWYDPSDFSTLFQDSAGSTPVTAAGQPVGLILDKSKGLTLGPELVTNGKFDANVNGWTGNGGTPVLSWNSGVLRIANGAAVASRATCTFNSVAGRYYEILVTEVGGTGIGGWNINTGARSSGSRRIVAATGATTTLDLYTGTGALGDYYEFDNISIRELPGNHSNQATAAARPVRATGIDLDGVDDSMSQSAGGGSTTAFMLCAAVKPEGGAASARTIWSDAGTNTGYIVRLNASNQLEMSVGNGTAYTTIATTATVDVGTAYVVTAWDDGTNLNVQVNNGTVASVARPTVSAGTATATLGKNNGAATGFFNGQLISVIQVKNDGGTADERTAAKAYAAGKGGVTL